MKYIFILLFSFIYLFGYTIDEKEPNNKIDTILQDGYVYRFFPLTIDGYLSNKDKKDIYMIKINGSLHIIFKWSDNNFFPIINILNGNREVINRLTIDDETSFSIGKHIINKKIYLNSGSYYFISIEDDNPILKRKSKYKLTLISSKSSNIPQKEMVIKLDEDSSFFKRDYYSIILKDYRDDLKIYNRNMKKGY